MITYVICFAGCTAVNAQPGRKTLLGIIIILAIVTVVAFIFKTLRKNI